MVPSQPKFYRLDLGGLQPNVDVSLSVISKGSNSPKLFVSKTQEYPNSQQEADFYSTTYSGNIVFVPNDYLKEAQFLHVGLICSGNRCEADVNFEFTREIIMEADGSKHIETANGLGGASSAVVRLHVPASDDAERIVIHIDAIPTRGDQIPTLSVFINYGDEIPYSSHTENIPRTSWFEGKTIVIYKGTSLFCTNCQYTLSLKFNQFSNINIEAQVYSTSADLGGYSMLDGVKKDKFNSYIFKVQDERKGEDLVIDVKPQQGKPTLYINCDSMPQSYRDYYWRYNINKAQEVILTSREHAKCQTGTYYMVVYGNEDSVYSIKAVAKKASKLFIGKDSPVIGDIFPNEKISYDIFMPMFAAEKIMIDLLAKASVEMSIINCRFPTDCPGLLPSDIEFRHQEGEGSAASYEPPEFKYDLETIEGGNRIVIDPHAAGCYPIIIQDSQFMQDALPVCAYQITLSLGSNPHPEEYSLKADSEGHQWLFVGIPKFASVLEGDTTYFLLNVPQKELKSISLQVTKFSGDVDVFVSKVEKFPAVETDDTKFSHEGLIIFKDEEELGGVYYIGVHGLQTSSFSISASVTGASGTEEDYAMAIDQGKPQKGVLLTNHEHPAKFYKFTLDLDEDWAGTIKISVNTLRGAVLVAVNNNDIVPLPNVHIWKSNGDLEISSDDDNFKSKGTYYIGVFVDWSVMQVSDVAFNIVYYLKETNKGTIAEGGKDGESSTINLEHLFLSPLTPYHGTIKKYEINYFEAFILPRDSGITIFKQADSGDVDIYLSVDPKNKYPDATDSTKSTKNTYKDSLELTEEDIKNACAGKTSTICSFYLSVIPRGGPSSPQTISYSLSMKRDYKESGKTALTPLEDGRQIPLTVPAKGGPALFYFYSVPYQPAVVTVACPGKEITIYASKKEVDVGASKENIQTPTSDRFEFSSKEAEGSNVGLAHLTIPPESKTDSTILVSLAVYFNDIDDGSGDDASSSTYYILVSSQMTHIYTGKPYYGAVKKDAYMYFFLNVYKPSCTLLISMTTLDEGDPDLVVSAATDERPTISHHRFASISKQRTEMLEINELDVYPKPNMEGQWIIGVYGRTASTFTLTVVYEDQKMVQLRPSVPFEMYLREDSTMYFTFYHAQSNNLEIKVDQLSGDIEAYVNALENDMDLVSHLPNKTSATWSLSPADNSVLNIGAEEEKACYQCLYLIGLEASAASKLSITVTEGSTVIQVQNGLRYGDVMKPQTSRTYMFASSSAEELTLNLNIRGPLFRVYASHNPTVNNTNYVWEMELSSRDSSKILNMPKKDYENARGQKSVWDGKRSVPSEKNFYFFLQNPGRSNVEYSFIASAGDSNPVLKSGVKHQTTIEAEGKTSFLFYSSQYDDVLKIVVEFTVERNSADGLDNDFERSLRKGLPVTANYWAEKTTTGRGQELEMNKEHVMRDNVQEKGSVLVYHLREAFTASSKKGKITIDIENPFYVPVGIAVTVYTTESGALALDQNSQHSSTLTKGPGETFEIYLSEEGIWYLWVHSCIGTLDLAVEDNPSKFGDGAKDIVKLGPNQQYLSKITTEGEGMKYVNLEKDSDSKVDPQFLLSTSFFKDDVLYDYNAAQSPPKINTEFTYSLMNSQMKTKISPVRVVRSDPSDEIVYHVKVCPYVEKDPSGPENFCKISEECKFYQQKFNINNQKEFEANFDRLMPGKHYVQVTADIQHNDKKVRFIPYPVEMVEIEEPLSEKFSNMIGTIMVALAVLLIAGLVCYKCYGRFKQFGEERGFEMQIFGKKQGYGFLGDDL